MNSVSVPSFAKVNVDLRVLDKRPDSYHELRTIFQTISLSDRLQIQFEKRRRTELQLDSSVEIDDNLVIRAATLVLERLRVSARIRFTLHKRIPMGAGLGGGSSNAASVLIALPALAGKSIPQAELMELAECLGSDVPFFLIGGTAVAFGRGTELYPLPDLPRHPALILASGIHVSTPEAYRALGRGSGELTSMPRSPILREFQTVAWNLAGAALEALPLKNDFEEAVFRLHPELGAQKRKLRRLGAKPVLMTGSGSAIFGVFPSVLAARNAASSFPSGTAHTVRFVPRRQFERAWRQSLGPAAASSCFENRV
ncbi:MAG TPA: 4-(cytidine 5'-diphospho)-2-C-methyl-D-erythritol kinase [Bryobacteraceae bacterium]|nr:4-(cytidine 5'-diphospho)-2-C-methyl-D-erythritol kinase [Bryobacteraceae bacterium]